MVALFTEMGKTENGAGWGAVGVQVSCFTHVAGFNQRAEAEASGILEQGSAPFLRYYYHFENGLEWSSNRGQTCEQETLGDWETGAVSQTLGVHVPFSTWLCRPSDLPS